MEIELSKYDIELRFVPGQKNPIADELSQHPISLVENINQISEKKRRRKYSKTKQFHIKYGHSEYKAILNTLE